MRRFMVWGLLMMATWVNAQPLELKIATQTDLTPAQHFFVGLLEAALREGADGRQVPVLHEIGFMEQERVVRELQRGRLLDIYWLGTTLEREETLRAIPIPLMRGLLGYRRFIIRKQMIGKFDQVKSLADLRQYTACQGLGWPDTDIMRASGLTVKTSPRVENIFRQLASGRCDYFPRGYFETFTEIAERTQVYPDLTTYSTLILHYPFPVYFFVNKDNKELAQWITTGLERMIDSGEFERYIAHHPFTEGVFPLAIQGNFRRIDIPNPYLPKNTNYNNPRYWILPGDWAITP